MYTSTSEAPAKYLPSSNWILRFYQEESFGAQAIIEMSSTILGRHIAVQSKNNFGLTLVEVEVYASMSRFFV